MIDTEDSVVTSLNELRKLKNERRQSRQRGQRSQAARVIDTASEELTPRPVQTQPIQTRDVVSQQTPAFSTFAPAPAVVFPDNRGMALAPTIIQQKSSAKPAIVVAALLIGAGAFGYIKLQGETQALLAAKNVEVRDAEEGRNKAIESLARTEQLAKTNLRQCEEKLKLAASAASTRSAPAIAPTDSSSSSSHKPTIARASSSRGARRVASVAPAEPATPKNSAVPTIAKRKVILDDPLAGLGKP